MMSPTRKWTKLPSSLFAVWMTTLSPKEIADDLLVFARK